MTILSTYQLSRTDPKNQTVNRKPEDQRTKENILLTNAEHSLVNVTRRTLSITVGVFPAGLATEIVAFLEKRVASLSERLGPRVDGSRSDRGGHGG